MDFSSNDLAERNLSICSACDLPFCTICGNGSPCPGCHRPRCEFCTTEDQLERKSKCPACYDRYHR